jgi:tetratricopeptide (TPR) repeat protein
VNWRRFFAVAAASGAALLLLEVLLRAVGSGHPSAFFIDKPDGKTRSNHYFGRLFYPPELLRGAYPSVFSTRKPPGTKRIFVLGESAAAGYPEPSFSFSRVLEAMLRRACPETTWEIINTGVTALNSHAILRIAAECARYEPDAVLVYMGNNEVVGPYGPGSLLGGDAVPLPLIRAVTWLRSMRVGQALQSLADAALRGGRPAMWSGLEMFEQARVAPGDPDLNRVYANFAANLRDIVTDLRARNIPVILSTVAANMTDCPPLGALPGGNDGSLVAYTGGLALRAAGNQEGAVAALRRARDLDEMRFRADTQINAIIRNVAAEEQCPLVDAEEDFLRLQLAAKPDGQPLFFEHVHFTLEGNIELARSFAGALSDLWGSKLACLQSDAFASVKREDIAADLGYSALAEGYSIGAITAMLAKPPFANQAGHAERIDGWNAKLREIEGLLTEPYLAGTIRQLEQAVEQRPRDGILWYWLARHYEDRKRWSEAETAYCRSLEVLPGNPAVLAQLGDLLWARGRKTEAVACFEKFLQIIPSHPGYRQKLLLGKMAE